jgi:hypothetical protein
VLLYDLTSTYVEDAAPQNPLLERGYSRDHRGDCPNLAAVRRRGGQYLVRTPRTKLRAVVRALLEGAWTRVREDVEAQVVPMPGGTETYVLCRSTARREKELAIRHRFSTRLEGPCGGWNVES